MAKAQKQTSTQQKAADTTASKAKAPATVTPIRSGPTQEQIARRAYELYLARGGEHGHAEQDWAQAERELQLGRY